MYVSSSNSEYYFYNVKKSILDLNFYDTDAYVSIIKRNNALNDLNLHIEKKTFFYPKTD
mgnify:CR=1 FL=1